ncbi:MAG: hypothetical protein ACI4U5_01420 [Bacilli bacterium]
MNKKSKLLLRLGLVTASLISLASCSFIKNIISGANEFLSSVQTTNRESLDNPTSNTIIDGDSFSDAGNNIKFKDVYENEGYVNLNSTGDAKILVIPVYFSDMPLSRLEKSEEETIKDLERTFFGTDSETNYWESVSSFYEKSSYNQLHISGKVSSFCLIDESLNNVAKMTYADPTYYVLRYAVSWYKNNYDDIQDFDLDGDGYIDAVWLVYANKYYSSSVSISEYSGFTSAAKDLLWAYTFWDYNRSPNKLSPVANCYAWASSHFMYSGTTTGVDAHTFIHETGHMMGLDDYYDYDCDTSKLSPAGGLDMMDCNIGDHNAYSKYLLGWVTPSLVKEEGEYVLKPFQDGGNSLLIPASLNEFSYSPFSEYLLIEFYTPTGLNELDATKAYCGYYPKMFTRYGVKIYHIDSRLIYINRKTNSFVYTNIFDKNKVTSSAGYSIAASNTCSSSIDESIKLIRLLSGTGTNNNFYGPRDASNSDLFINGDSISSFTFNSGYSLDYKITISISSSLLQNPTEVKIKITNK